MKNFRCLTAGVAGIVLTGMAAADISYSVTIQEDDFSSELAVARLHERIQQVSVEVCPRYFVSRDLGDTTECRRDVQADLVARINHPVLNAYLTSGEQLELALQAQRGAREVTMTGR